jgi:phage/plasmid-like protein (TIGR03299 family)
MMPANVESMAYYGEAPWHGLGTQVKKGVIAAEMIKAAGLDWKVKMRPARGAIINKKDEANRYEIIRLPRQDRDESEVLFGVVSKRYQPLQNSEAFEFFDPIIEDGKAYFETAGALGQGERIWVMARMPDPIEVVYGDECWKYLLLSNTHNGEGSVLVKFTCIRVVCQNTLILALNDDQKAYRVRHSKVMSERLTELSEILALAQRVYVTAGKLFKDMAAIKLTGKLLDEYLERVFPRTLNQKKRREESQRWTHIKTVLETAPDLQGLGVRGTLWSAYNAITRFEDYKYQRKDEEQEERLSRTWFGAGADIKLKAYQVAEALTRAS